MLTVAVVILSNVFVTFLDAGNQYTTDVKCSAIPTTTATAAISTRTSVQPGLLLSSLVCRSYLCRIEISAILYFHHQLVVAGDNNKFSFHYDIFNPVLDRGRPDGRGHRKIIPLRPTLGREDR